MKVKLLKKLRKEARKKYWMERWNWHRSKFVICSNIYNDCTSNFHSSYQNIEAASSHLIELRREFILDKLHEYGKLNDKYVIK